MTRVKCLPGFLTVFGLEKHSGLNESQAILLGCLLDFWLAV